MSKRSKKIEETTKLKNIWVGVPEFNCRKFIVYTLHCRFSDEQSLNYCCYLCANDTAILEANNDRWSM